MHIARVSYLYISVYFFPNLIFISIECYKQASLYNTCINHLSKHWNHSSYLQIAVMFTLDLWFYMYIYDCEKRSKSCMIVHVWLSSVKTCNSYESLGKNIYCTLCIIYVYIYISTTVLLTVHMGYLKCWNVPQEMKLS